jgi:predicted DNA-binding transcriptional regulator AlpA
MRAERAAAYLDMSTSSFFRLVEEGAIPPGVPIKGLVVWDRLELDSAFENFKGGGDGNTMHRILGIKT